MKLIYCVLLLLCPYLSWAQPLPQGLAIGENMPAVVSTNVLNHTSTSINTASFRGKVLILDFIRTTCSGCLAKLEAYEQLQHQYKDKLAILLVSAEKTSTVKAYMNRPSALPLRFPIITDDVKLSSLFPHESLSHLVWISPKGNVAAITEGDYLKAENVAAALQNDVLPWPVKRDVPFFNYGLSMINLSEQTASFIAKPLQYSALLPYLPDVSSRYYELEDTTVGAIRWQFYNLSIIQFYCRLFKKSHFPLSQVILEANNKQRFFYLQEYGVRRGWLEKNSYSYEAVLPNNKDILTNRKTIQQQLDTQFGLQTNFTMQPMQCWEITPIKTPAPSPENGIILWEVARLLNQRFSQQPVMLSHDSLDYIKIAITEKEIANDVLLQQRLEEAGYELRPITKTMEVLHIKENF